MLLSIEDAILKKIDGFIELKAYFYILGGINEMAFLSDSNDGDFGKIITLPKDIIPKVIEQDETFGILVGGKYAYYAMKALVKGIIAIVNDQQFFSKVDELTLIENDRRQVLTFSIN